MNAEEKTKKVNVRFIPYYGSKRRMVKKLKKMIPEHRTYLEPFVGSGALLLNHERSDLEIVNDKDKEIANLFEIMADRKNGRQFINELQTIHYGKELFEAVKCAKKKYFNQFTKVERAVLKYYLLTTSFNATGKHFATGRVASEEEYRKRVCRFLEEVYERLDGVIVLNVDALDLVEEFVEDENTFIFMDPPYLKSLRGKGAGNVYGCEMGIREHITMLKTIRNAKAKIMLCGYWMGADDLYDSVLIPYGWNRIFVGDYPKNAQKQKVRDMGSEYVWINYTLPVDIEEKMLENEK